MIYLVERDDGKPMGQRFANGPQGIEAIVREHYRECFNDSAIDVAVDLDSFIVTAAGQRYKKTYMIANIQRMQ